MYKKLGVKENLRIWKNYLKKYNYVLHVGKNVWNRKNGEKKLMSGKNQKNLHRHCRNVQYNQLFVATCVHN